MKSVYVVLSKRNSPIAITYPWPVAAFATRKEAQDYAAHKNSRAQMNEYAVMRVPFGEQKCN